MTDPMGKRSAGERAIGCLTGSLPLLLVPGCIGVLVAAVEDGGIRIPRDPALGAHALLSQPFLLVLVGLIVLGFLAPFLVAVVRVALWRRRADRYWRRLRSAVGAATPSEAVRGTTRRFTPEEIAGAFGPPIVPAPRPRRYRVGMLLVAVALVLLVVVYIGLIAVVAWAMWYHARAHLMVLSWSVTKWLTAILYVVPLGVGGILIFFMLKPLLAPLPRAFEPRRLSPRDEPALFAFVGRLADAVGAPRPQRIQVDCDNNAAAGFPGRLHWFFSRSFVFTLGLPMAAGMDVRQLASVVAHELGHFGQGAGLRMSILTRQIIVWMWRVVHERDMWDAILRSAGSGGVLRVLMVVAWPFIQLTRGILYVLMWLGSLIGGVFSRQMEYDADRCSAELVGVDVFETAQRRTFLLDVAVSMVHGELQTSWREHRLCANVPRYVAESVERIPDDAVADILKHTYEQKTHLFDIHPSPRERRTAVRRADPVGTFHLDGPATALFRDFDALAESVTFEYYQHLLGEEVSRENLVGVDAFVDEQKRMDADYRSLGRFCAGVYSVRPPVQLDASLLVASAEVAQDRRILIDARERTAAASAAGREALADDARAFDMRHAATLAEFLLRAGMPIKAEQFGLRVANDAGVSLRRSQARELATEAQGKLTALFKPMTVRLIAALRLLRAPGVAADLDGADALAAEADTMQQTLITLVGTWNHVVKLQRDNALAAGLCEILGAVPVEVLKGRLEGMVADCRLSILSIRDRFGDVPYPFEHAGGSISLTEYVVGKMPPEKDVGAVLDTAGTVLTRLPEVYYRVLSRLAFVAEKVETALGLPLMPDPPVPTHEPSP